MFARIDELKTQIQDAVYSDVRKTTSNQDFDEGIEFDYHQLFFENQPALKTVILERYNLISNALNNEMYECPDIISSTDITVLENKIKTYPNPANDIINIDTEVFNNKDFSVHMINSLGQEIPIDLLDSSTVKISELNNGIFFLVFKSGNQIVTKIFVKKTDNNHNKTIHCMESLFDTRAKSVLCFYKESTVHLCAYQFHSYFWINSISVS